MITEILQLEFIMVIMVLIGVFLKTKGIVTDEGRECLTDIVIDIILPCNIISSFIGQGNLKTLMESMPIIGMSILMMLLSILVGKVAFGRMDPYSGQLAKYGMLNSNSMFIGLPVVISLLGEKGGMLQNLYMIFVRMFIWSYGLNLLSGKGMDLKTTLKKACTNPCMVAAFAGIILMLLDYDPPVFISRTLGYFSNCLLPISMLLIGCVLNGIEIRDLTRLDVWWFCIVRLLMTPALALGICLLLHLDYYMTGVVVLMMAMPCASLAAVLAVRYQYNALYGSLIVAVSTIMSIVGIPFWFLIICRVFGV